MKNDLARQAEDFGIWILNPDIRKRTLAGETILLNIKTNRLLVLNESAAAVWDCIALLGFRRETEIVKTLQKEYNCGPTEKLKEDVHKMLLDFQEREFLRRNGKTDRSYAVSNRAALQNISGHLSFSERLHQLASEQNVPISGGLEITQRCDLRCLHCYIDNQPIGGKDELPTRDICAVLEQAAERGCLWLLITGGEPLLRKDFADIYRHAKELGMIVTVFTNAIHLTEELVDVFVMYPPFLVEATLHGATEETFDAVTGIPGSFCRFKHGIELLRQHNIPFHLKMVVMRRNLHEVEVAKEFALAVGAGDFRFDPMINADLLHSRKANNLRITMNEAIALDLLEPYKSRWLRIFQSALDKRTALPPSNGLLFPCRAGKCSFTVSADGNLLPCILMRIPAYNLRDMSFAEAWERLNRHTSGARMEKDNPCLACPTQTCSKCPAWGYLEHGNPHAKSQFACSLQQAREEIFLRNINGKGGMNYAERMGTAESRGSEGEGR